MKLASVGMVVRIEKPGSFNCRFFFTSDSTALRQRSTSLTPSGNDLYLTVLLASAESGPQSSTFVKSIHIRLTFRSCPTASTISREIAIVIVSPSPSLRTSSPHSFSANAASSTRRFVARARSASVQCTTVCTAALPSGAGTVSYVLSIGTGAAGPNWPKPMLSRVAGDAPPPLSGELGTADSPSQPLVRFVRLCGDDVMSTLIRTWERSGRWLVLIEGKSGGSVDRSWLV